MLALVSSTEAACSVLAWLMLWAVAETSSEALARPSAELRTSLMICARVVVMARTDASMLVVSPSRVATSTLRSPRATRCTTSAA